MTERAAASSLPFARPLLEVAFATAVGAGVVSLLQEHPRVLAMALALVALVYPFRRGLRGATAASTAAIRSGQASTSSTVRPLASATPKLRTALLRLSRA